MSKPPSHPDFIVLDSNVFIADYWLRSPSFVLLKDFLTKTGTKLVVPLIVLQETTNHHSEDLRIAESDVRRAQREITRLLPKLSADHDYLPSISRTMRELPYETFLKKELSRLGAIIQDYDGIPHSDVVSRDLGRRRPFQQSGKGYRDTLLWETVLRNYITKDGFTVLITQNKKDFCDADGNRAHLDLRRDVIQRAGLRSRLEIYKDLPEFTDAKIVPFLKTRRDFAILVENKKVPGLDLENILENKIEAIIEAINDSPSCMIGEPETYGPEVDVIDNLYGIRLVEVSEISKHVLLIECEFETDVAFTYFLPRSEYATLTDAESATVAILDGNWNEHVMQVESSRKVHLKCRLTFNTTKAAVESFEVDVE